MASGHLIMIRRHDGLNILPGKWPLNSSSRRLGRHTALLCMRIVPGWPGQHAIHTAAARTQLAALNVDDGLSVFDMQFSCALIERLDG